MASEKTLQTTIEIAGVLSPSLQSAISNAVDKLSDMASETLDSADAASRLVAEMEQQENVLNSMKRAYAGYVASGEKGSKEAKQLKKTINDVSKEFRENQQTLENAERAADELGGGFNDLGDDAKGASDGFTVMKGALANLVADGIGKAVDGLKEMAGAAMEAYQKYDEGADIIIQKTGATGDAAAGLQAVYKNVSKSVTGEFSDIGAAVGEINTRFGLTGKDLEDLSVKFLKFAELNGTDVNGTIDSTQKALAAFGLDAGDAGGLLDTLNKVGQDTGVSMDTLTDLLLENASSFSQLGLDVHQSAALLGDVEKSGVTVEATMQALSKASQYAAEKGKPLTDVLEKTTEQMKNAKTDTEGLQVAYDIFGKKAGAKIYEAVKNGTLNLAELDKAMQNTAGSVENTYEATQDGMDKVALAVQSAKAEVGDSLAGFFDDHKDDIVKGIEEVADGISSALGWITENGPQIVQWCETNFPTIATALGGVAAATAAFKWGSIVGGIQKVIGAFKTFGAVLAANPIGLIILGITALVAGFMYLWNNCESFREFWINLWDNVKTIAVNVWNGIKDFFVNLWNGIKDIASSVWNGLKDFFSNLWNGIKDGVVKAWNAIKNAVMVGVMFVGSILSAAFQIITLPFRFIWENCKEYVFAAWEAIKSGVSTAINAVKSVITTVWNAIKSVTSTVWEAIKSVVSTVWDAIKSAVSTAIDAVKSVISTVWNAIKSVTSSVWNGIKSVVTNVWNGIKSGVSTAINNVKSTVTNVWNGIKSVTSTVWENIKTAITKPIKSAWETVKGIIDKIKGAFDFEWSLPKLKMPHFSIEGEFSFSPPSVPKFTVDWYKNGGILTQPTIFGAAGNTLLAGGEAGAEAVLPLSTLWKKMDAILRNILSSSGVGQEDFTTTAGKLLTLDDFSLGSLANSTDVAIYYDFSGFTWNPQIEGNGSNGEDDLMARLKAHEAEFFDWLEEFVQAREVAQYA